jgi:hypothetical protein
LKRLFENLRRQILIRLGNTNHQTFPRMFRGQVGMQDELCLRFGKVRDLEILVDLFQELVCFCEPQIFRRARRKTSLQVGRE